MDISVSPILSVVLLLFVLWRIACALREINCSEKHVHLSQGAGTYKSGLLHFFSPREVCSCCGKWFGGMYMTFHN